MNKVNTKKLAAIPKQSPEAKAICEYLAQRERASRTTNLRGFMNLLQNHLGKEIKNRGAFDRTWVDLEASGVGGVVYSSRGIPKHYDWQGWDSKSVGEAALDPSKHPERTKFRTRPLKKTRVKAPVRPNLVVEEDDDADLVESRVTQAQMTRSLPQTFTASSGKPSGSKVFGLFHTQNLEAIKVELKKGLTVQDRENLIAFIRELPTDNS